MGLSKEARVLLYTKMYTAVSKATAETKNAKGESVKTTYNGKIADLFKEITTNPDLIARFMWAITHKTDALPTVLFRVLSHGHNPAEITRVHSGFYDDQRNHITGIALVPFIMEAVLLYKPTPRVKKEPVEQLVCNEKVVESSNSTESMIPILKSTPIVCNNKGEELDITTLSDNVLTCLQYEIQKEFERRAAVREKQARLQQVLELAEMSIDELKDLLAL